MALPPIPTPRATVTVGGVEVAIRGLTLGEVKELDALGKTDAEATGVAALAWGCDVSVDEARTWIEATSPQFGAAVAEHIMRLSGMAEETGARFPERLHEGGRRSKPVRAVRQAKENAGGDAGHAA